jgi:hypothetical protein
LEIIKNNFEKTTREAKIQKIGENLGAYLLSG